LELSCTIVETFNEEKHVWPSYFLENLDPCVALLWTILFIFVEHLGCVRMYLHTIDYSYVCLLHSYFYFFQGIFF
jgi:hypothetical protein